MWVSIEDELPMMSVFDFVQRGFRIVKCKFIDGSEQDCGVADHHTWYFDAKNIEVTHWWKDDPNEVTAKPIKNY